MARVVRFHKLGGPQVLQIDDLGVGEPGPGEVRIMVKAFGLNRVEAMFRCGEFGLPNLPSKIGYEAAGIIEAVGYGVDNVKPGDRVATLPGLSMEEYGTNGELILYPAAQLVPIPDHQSMTDAAATWMQYLTAYGLIAHGKIQSGDTVVITAASSSVGLAAIQICNMVGAVPIAVTRSRKKANGLLNKGASQVIVSDEDEVAQAILQLTDGKGAKVLFDAVAGQPLAQLLSSLAPQGVAILYGTLAGAELTLALQSVLLHGLTIRGFAANELLENSLQRAEAINFIQSGIEQGHLIPVIDRLFPFSEIVKAHEYLEGNTQLGKIVIGELP